MKISINKKIDYKPEANDHIAFRSLATEFENVDLSIAELADMIACGYSFCAQHHLRRTSENFLASDYIAVDIDDGLTMAEAMAMPYVQNYAAIVYPTVNSTPEHNRFRIIFALAKTINDRSEMKDAYTGATRKFDGDGACKDACRLFYGNKGCEPLVLNNILPNDMLDELIALGAQKRVRAELVREEVTRQITVQRGNLTLQNEQTIRTASGNVELIGKLNKGTVVFCPVHLDKRPSAFVTQSRNGTNGVYCSACATTYWPENISSAPVSHYNFYAIDDDLHYVEYEEDPRNCYGPDAPEEFFSHSNRMVHSSNSKFLAGINFALGITLVRSPKGSGKSENIVRYVQQCKEKNLSVLLIGHRQALIAALSRRLGLDCYLDNRECVTKHYAISLDSIPRLLDLRKNKFDVIIIDEVEQVLSHLSSDTLQRNRRQCYLMLERYLARAQAVLACDADLGYLSLSTISAARNGELPTQFYINRFKEVDRSIDLYKSENHLLAELLINVERGGRYYVCSNSKRKAQLIYQAVTKLGQRIRAVVITSDNSKSIEIRNFLENIVEETERYDVIIASPSIGTGIDITFPNDEQRITGVYGFFGPKINSHFEIDQQLARVRNPGYIKCWVSPEKFSFEVEPDAIKRNFVELGVVPDVQISYDENDTMTYAEDDPLLSLIAEVLSLNRASKNNLRKHFIDLKIYNGWSVNIVEPEDQSSVLGSAARQSARDSLLSDYSIQLCNAEQISQIDAQRLKGAVIHTPAQKFSLERFALENFYEQKIDEQLVRLDENGRLRKKIALLAQYLQTTADVEKTGRAPIGKAVGALLWHLLRTSHLTDENGNFIEQKFIDANMLSAFVDACTSKKSEIEALLGTSLRSDYRAKPITQLGELLRLMGCRWEKVMKRDVAGIRTHSYRLDFSRYKFLAKCAERLNKTAP